MEKDAHEEEEVRVTVHNGIQESPESVISSPNPGYSSVQQVEGTGHQEGHSSQSEAPLVKEPGSDKGQDEPSNGQGVG
jgi:hypothetical protein